MKSNEIRQKFYDFYLEKDHKQVPSAPLVPRDDPTLLFTSAGMVQFKRLFSGTVELPYRRAVTVQKCLRVTDIEEVGRTPRHDTFFEMLGHFSFGDYFKREAIFWNWELFTRVYGMDPARLTASVFETDDEAYAIWEKEIGLPTSQIVRLGAKDNFWGPAGGIGACGPCSELYYDLGPEVDPGRDDLRPGDECNRYVEIGNFVFPQFDRQEDGSDLPLKNRGIDTGIGLERVAMALQGKTSIFHTDLFWPMVERSAEVCGKPYEGNEVPLNIIADHVRALTFALGEGIMPSNEGRGYVIRRLIRRAAVQGYTLGIERPFLFDLIDIVVEMMQKAYPEVKESRSKVITSIKNEEIKFHETVEHGLGKLHGSLQKISTAGGKTISGEEAFLLYDTFGLPLDLINDVALGLGIEVDQVGFDQCMQQQKSRSRASAKFAVSGEKLLWQEVSGGEHSRFQGYDAAEISCRVRRYAALNDVDSRFLVVLDQTPFYGESGGQSGDTGTLISGETTLHVVDTVREGEEFWHLVSPLKPARTADGVDKPPSTPVTADVISALSADSPWVAAVTIERRDGIERHHTATHLLHTALRRVLGNHVTQAGSLVAPDHLRFDFAHTSAVSTSEKEEVERIVNEVIMANLPVEVTCSSYDDAIRDGVTALFGEKYDADEVRRVKTGDFSEELCGGTHVDSTGQIGVMIIVEETAVAAGTRRIEALCGGAALEKIQNLRSGTDNLRTSLGAPIEEMPSKISTMFKEISSLRKELSSLRRGQGLSHLDTLLQQAKQVGDYQYLVGEVPAGTVDEFRELGDNVRRKLTNGVAVLCASIGKKTSFLAVVSDTAIESKKIRADVLVRQVASVTGGGGGGKPHMALGGAADKSKVPEALLAAGKILQELLS